jgi:hypothetical protein
VPKDYEIEVDVAIARIADALLSDRNFIASLADKLRSQGFKTSRNTPGQSGSSTRNPNSPRINPPS